MGNLETILMSSNLFKEISQEEIEQLTRRYAYKIKNYSPKDVFALAGDRINELTIVLQGTLVTNMVSESGKYIQIDRLDKGRIVAPAMLFAEDNCCPVNVLPINDVLVFTMHKNVFLDVLNAHNKVLFNFIRIISDVNRFLTEKIHLVSLKSIRGKIAEYILRLAQEQESNTIVNLNLSRQALADKFGVSRQALSRSLSELNEEGLINVQGKKITIINRERLLAEE
ncbi:MAG: Crp/Fnr family transcriptional regulator [Bacteroides sp.]|nr:Crp/Fnr family transcriptional regulator [Bacteroides sp.]